jgi:phage FluMu protein Com
MPRTILCPKCGIVLNLPAAVSAGKRMKCPKCSHRFAVSEKDASSESTLGGDADADILSSRDFGKRPPSHDNLPVPVGDQDLRDLFDLPLGTAASIEKSAVSSQKPVLSDAEALLHEPTVRKKKSRGAEARAQARRCVSCGGFVPKGMSICAVCGVDQDTGMRVGLDDDLVPQPRPAATGPPLHIAITGFLCGLTSLLLLVLSLIQSVRGQPGMTQYGWLCLALVSAFGIYGAIQFFIGRSVKYLMLALTLGILVDAMALIALPIYQATFADQEAVVTKVTKKDNPDSMDDEDVQIIPITDRLDLQKIEGGLIVILLYALLSIYLMSPPVKRYLIRQAALDSTPIF